MENKLHKYNIVSYVLTSITLFFFIGILLFGISALNGIFQSGEESDLGIGLTIALMIFFFIICLIPTICFALGSIALCIPPLKNKYHTKANIIKLILNILVLVTCITILLIFKLRE